MRSPLTGAIATISVFLPLIAVPLLALFGMPELPGMSAPMRSDELKFVDEVTSNVASMPETTTRTPPASSNGDAKRTLHVSDSSAGAEAPQDQAPAKRAQADPFAEFARPSSTEPGQRGSVAASEQRTAERHTPGGTIDEGNGLPQKSLVAFSQEVSRKDREVSAAGPPLVPSPSLNWKGVVRRLNALGIRDFQLQPGLRDGEFHFSCRFTSRGNPRVVHRFEAEAAEPLDAVAEVLRQIDDWKLSKPAHPNGRTTAAGGQRKISRGDPFDESPSISDVNVTNR